jgi:hypothetical protein
MEKLTPGEREVCEYIVERYGHYSEFDPTNTTVPDWVEKTKQQLISDDKARIIEERDC